MIHIAQGCCAFKFLHLQNKAVETKVRYCHLSFHTMLSAMCLRQSCAKRMKPGASPMLLLKNKTGLNQEMNKMSFLFQSRFSNPPFLWNSITFLTSKFNLSKASKSTQSLNKRTGCSVLKRSIFMWLKEYSTAA